MALVLRLALYARAAVRRCIYMNEGEYITWPSGAAINSGRLLIRYSDKRSHEQVRSAWESALFFFPGGVVAWALERIEINWQLGHSMGRQLGSLRQSRGQSQRAVGVPPVQTLRGAIGWKLNRDGISQSEPVSTGCELVAWERRGGAGIQPLHRPAGKPLE